MMCVKHSQMCETSEMFHALRHFTHIMLFEVHAHHAIRSSRTSCKLHIMLFLILLPVSVTALCLYAQIPGREFADLPLISGKLHDYFHQLL